MWKKITVKKIFVKTGTEFGRTFAIVYATQYAYLNNMYSRNTICIPEQHV